MRSRFVVVLLLVTLASLSATTGSASASTAATSVAGRTLTLGVAAAPDSLAADNGSGPPWYGQAVYDSLLRYADTNQLDPDLATAWSYNGSDSVLTMTLRSGVKFTDGTALTAVVVAENLERLKSSTSTIADQLSSVSSVVATGPTHLVINLSQPDPSLLYNLSQQAGEIESPSYIDNKTDPVGTGPYEYDAAASVPGSTYVYTKNPNYWNKPEQHYAKLVLKVFGDETSTLDAIQANQVDAADLSLVQDSREITSQLGWRLLSYSGGYSILLLLDRSGTQNACLKDVRVRQAVNYAINRPGLFKAIATTENESGTISDSTFEPGDQGYNAAVSSYYSYDPAKARKLMKAAGYSHGCTITLMNFAQLEQANNLIAPELAAVGIKTQLMNVSLTQSVNAISTAQVPATFWGLDRYTLAWEDVQQMYAPNAPYNPFHTSTTQLKGLITRLQTARTSSEANAAALQINRYLVQQAWNAPLWYGVSYFAVGPTVRAKVSAGTTYSVSNLWDMEPKR